MYLYFLIIVAVLICVLGVSFHLKNDQLVTLDYYIGTFDYHFSIFIIASIIIGVIIGLVIIMPKLFLLKNEKRKLQRQIDLKDKEVNNLRTLPIKDDH